MPNGIEVLEIKGLKLGDDYVDLTLYCVNGSVGVKAKNCPAGCQVLMITEGEK